MKKNILLPLISLLFFITTDAQAKQPCADKKSSVDWMNFYAKILGGANFLQNTTINENKASYQTGYTAAGSLGYYWHKYRLHLEAQYAFRRNAINTIHFITEGSSKNGYSQTSSYMANLLWDLPSACTFWHIQPFIGGGIGYDFQKMHALNSRVIFNQKWNRFAWQAMAGFAYPIFRNTEISLEYTFHQGGGHFYNHAIGIGLLYKFGFIRKKT